MAGGRLQAFLAPPGWSAALGRNEAVRVSSENRALDVLTRRTIYSSSGHPVLYLATLVTTQVKNLAETWDIISLD